MQHHEVQFTSEGRIRRETAMVRIDIFGKLTWVSNEGNVVDDKERWREFVDMTEVKDLGKHGFEIVPPMITYRVTHGDGDFDEYTYAVLQRWRTE